MPYFNQLQIIDIKGQPAPTIDGTTAHLNGIFMSWPREYRLDWFDQRVDNLLIEYAASFGFTLTWDNGAHVLYPSMLTEAQAIKMLNVPALATQERKACQQGKEVQ